jgi:hypothetical protein
MTCNKCPVKNAMQKATNFANKNALPIGSAYKLDI